MLFRQIFLGAHTAQMVSKHVWVCCCYGLLVFFNWVPHMQLSHMIPGVNIIGRKVSVVIINGAGGSGGVLRPQWVP